MLNATVFFSTISPIAKFIQSFVDLPIKLSLLLALELIEAHWRAFAVFSVSTITGLLRPKHILIVWYNKAFNKQWKTFQTFSFDWNALRFSLERFQPFGQWRWSLACSIFSPILRFSLPLYLHHLHISRLWPNHLLLRFNTHSIEIYKELCVVSFSFGASPWPMTKWRASRLPSDPMPTISRFLDNGKKIDWPYIVDKNRRFRLLNIEIRIGFELICFLFDGISFRVLSASVSFVFRPSMFNCRRCGRLLLPSH